MFNQAYRCEGDGCGETKPVVYSSVYADGLSLPYRSEPRLPQQQAVRRYLEAVPSVLLTKGQAPFRLAGLTIFEALSRLTNSLARTRDWQAHPLLDQRERMTQSHDAQQEAYAHGIEQ